MQIFALGILVVQVADREGRPELAPLYLGFMGLARAVPGLAFTLVAGAVADRVDRRRLLLITQSTMALNAAALALVSFLGAVSLWNILLAALVQSASFAFDNPARQSMVAHVVPRPFLPSAIGLQSAAFNGSSIAGPLFAGLLYLPLGVSGLLALNALSFISILFALFTMQPVLPAADRPSHSLVASVLEGARHIRRSPTMFWVLVMAATVFGSAGTVNALLPAVAGETLWNGMSWLALLLAAFGLGAFTGSFATMNIGRLRRPGRLFVAGAIGNGAMLVAFALTVNPVVALACGYCTGLCGTVMAGMGNNMLQATTGDAYRGRVMSVWAITFIGIMPIGQLVLGTIGSLLGIHAALIVAGTVAMTSGVYALVRIPSVRDWRAPTRREEPATAQPTVAVGQPTFR